MHHGSPPLGGVAMPKRVSLVRASALPGVSGGRDPADTNVQGRIRLANNNTLERVQGIVAERLGVEEDQVTENAAFIEDLNADSLDLVEVIMAMEQEFDLEISDEDAEKIRTVGDAVSYINEHQGA